VTTNTELRILQVVGRLGEPTSLTISRELMISLSYAEYLCKYLVREGHLEFIPGDRYRLSQWRAPPRAADRFSGAAEEEGELIEELARKIAWRLGMRGPAGERRVEIKTDFIEPICLEDAEMETNIDRVDTVEEKGHEFEAALELLKRLRRA